MNPLAWRICAGPAKRVKQRGPGMRCCAGYVSMVRRSQAVACLGLPRNRPVQICANSCYHWTLRVFAPAMIRPGRAGNYGKLFPPGTKPGKAVSRGSHPTLPTCMPGVELRLPGCGEIPVGAQGPDQGFFITRLSMPFACKRRRISSACRAPCTGPTRTRYQVASLTVTD